MILDTFCLTLRIIRYVSMVKWSKTAKGISPSLTLPCRSNRKGSLQVILDYGHRLTLLICVIIYLTICVFIYIIYYICIHIRVAFNEFPDLFFVQAFKIVVDSWKFSKLLLYILWDHWPIFMISILNEQLQQQLEYTLLNPDCHS